MIAVYVYAAGVVSIMLIGAVHRAVSTGGPTLQEAVVAACAWPITAAILAAYAVDLAIRKIRGK